VVWVRSEWSSCGFEERGREECGGGRGHGGGGAP
jgi:hypothetical protein